MMPHTYNLNTLEAEAGGLQTIVSKIFWFALDYLVFNLKKKNSMICMNLENLLFYEIV